MLRPYRVIIEGCWAIAGNRLDCWGEALQQDGGLVFRVVGAMLRPYIAARWGIGLSSGWRNASPVHCGKMG
ncbi:MAG: hypothetical protein ACFE0J_24695, partial [Elainellaceae cyanobacterium]